MEYRIKWYETTKNMLEKTRIVILQGLRRIGKTTIMKNIIKDMGDYKIIEHEFNQFGHNDEQYLLDLLEKLRNTKEPHLLAFDEFQDFPDWNRFFKTIFDTCEHVKIIATGSVSHNTTATNNTEGGRYKIITMHTLSLNEYRTIYNDELKGMSDYEVFNKYSTMGSYPDKTWSVDGISSYKKQIDYNIIEKITESKLLDRYSIGKGEHVDSILKYIIQNVGGSTSYYKISKHTGINQLLVGKIIAYLIDNHIIYKFENLIKGFGKSSALDTKYYLNDSSFYLFNKAREFDNLESHQKSMVFENIIINHIKRMRDRGHEQLGFYYQKNKVEIDVMLDDGHEHYYEIKYTDSIKSLSGSQSIFARENELNVIYLGKTKRHNGVNYINAIEFLSKD